MEGLRQDRLETERLVLRRATMADLADIHAVLSDRQAMRYWSSPAHEEIQQSREWLSSMVEADPAISDDFLLEHEGKVIGKLGGWRLPEFGFILRSDCQRQGLGSEAMTAFLDYMRVRKFPQLKADVDPRNAASLAILKKHGFYETGRKANTWFLNGEWCDSIYLALDLA
jgi:RimJ/RimL family protein N-acetyltransferase